MKWIATLDLPIRDALRDWCRKQPLADVTKSSYVNGRLEKWYYHASNLQFATRGKITVADKIDGDVGQILENIGKQLPGWNSILVCGGPTTINWHRDHAHFYGPAVMINLGTADYMEADRNQDVTGKEKLFAFTTNKLEDGMLVRIDTKMPHRAVQTSSERFNITFRTIKPEYMVGV